MSTDLTRHALNGPTMGTRWSALFHTDPGCDPRPTHAALQAAVGQVDAQMSTWTPDSDLMRLNGAPVGVWQAVPRHLCDVLALGLKIGRASAGAFEIGMGDVVAAWGFGPGDAAPERIRAAMQAPRRPAHEVLEIDHAALRVRKTAALTLDLNGIAKGYGVDRLAQVLADFGIVSGLVGIDGEMRALGAQPCGAPWAIAIEAPDTARRAPRSVLSLQDAAVATSGDYRHWVQVQGQRLSHSMDPRRGAPARATPASVTVVAETCARADAWATALMVLGPEHGPARARREGLDALFMLRTADHGMRSIGTGALFGAG